MQLFAILLPTPVVLLTIAAVYGVIWPDLSARSRKQRIQTKTPYPAKARKSVQA